MRLRALAELLPQFEAPDVEFGRWSSPPNGLPYFDLGPAGLAFVRAAGRGGWVTPAVNWREWAATDECQRFRADPSAIGSATPEQLERLLTLIVRSDRFNEGELAAAFESGVLARILQRATALLHDLDRP